MIIMKPLLIAAVFTAGVVAQKCPSNGVGASVVATPPGIKAANIPKGCSQFEILVARGTGEYDRNATSEKGPGKFGVVVGDPLVDAVVKVITTARGYPVQYPASVSATSVSAGVSDVNKRLNHMSKECPDMKFAIVGYSQGAGVMHSAASSFASTVKPKILAAVMFGDPSHKSGTGYFSGIKTMNVCNTGSKQQPPDPVCASGGTFCFDSHVHYSEDRFMGPATEYLIKAFKGMPLTSQVVKGNEPWKPEASLTETKGGEKVEMVYKA